MEYDQDKIQKHIAKIKKVTSGENIIAGIHNYCDRWCERCTHTKHCSVYQMERLGQKEGEDIEEVSDIDNKNFWKNLSLNMAATMEMLRQEMNKIGVDINSLPEVKEEVHIETEVENLTKDYSYSLMKWLNKNDEYFKQVMLQESVENEAMVFAVDDAIEIITWYSMFIHVKTRRSMHVENNPFDEEEDFEFRFHDNLGSAKITLISINRSMESFSFLLKYMTEKETDILHFLALLEKSKKLITRRWPTAMNFKRPGFDN
jgi:hypothetical protein